MLREYVYFDGRVVGMLSAQLPGKVLRVHADHLGTPRAVSDGPLVLWRWEGDAFGDMLPNEDVDGNGQSLTMPLRMPGQYFDREVGLFYNYFRDYDPATGRYVESDPIGLQGGMNTYGYVGGNVFGAVDPSGTNTLAGAGLGAEAGGSVAGPLGGIVGGVVGAAAGYALGNKVADSLGNEKCETCKSKYPDKPRCELLQNYNYNSFREAILAMRWMGYSKHNEQPVNKGICVGNGSHWNIRNGSLRVGSIASCNCCQETGSGPVLKTKYKVF